MKKKTVFRIIGAVIIVAFAAIAFLTVTANRSYGQENSGVYALGSNGEWTQADGVDNFQWFRSAQISGIAGESLEMAYFEADSDYMPIDGNWRCEALGINTTATEFMYIFPNIVNIGYELEFVSSDETASAIVYSMVTKYSLAEFYIVEDSDVGKSDGDFCEGAYLKVEDFNLEMNLPIAADLEYGINKITWYCVDNEEWEYETSDTTESCPTKIEDGGAGFGDYYIKLEIIYTISYNGEVETYTKENISNTVPVLEITIYPNPTTELLYIEGADVETEYSVYSMTGQEVLRGEGDVINVSDLSFGTYILRTPNKDLKFIVQ